MAYTHSQQASITANDVVIAVMGVTGCGKSTLVNYFCEDAKIGNGLRSCTEHVEPYLCNSFPLAGGKRLFLVDTPGFDDSGSNRTDTDILSDIAAFLSSTYQNKILLTGVIYLHRISDNRVGGSGLRQMNMFRKLCGERSMKNIVIATTMWDNTSPTEAANREDELRSGDGFFGQMIRNGARLMRQDRGKDSAIEIGQYLLSVRDKAVLDIQTEMVDKNKRLDETGAGKVVEAELMKLKKKHEKELEDLKHEMRESIKQKDVALTNELAAVKANIESRLKQEQESSRRLQQNHQDLMQRMQQQHNQEQTRLQQMMDQERREQRNLTQQMGSMSLLKAQCEREARQNEQTKRRNDEQARKNEEKARILEQADALQAEAQRRLRDSAGQLAMAYANAYAQGPPTYYYYR